MTEKRAEDEHHGLVQSALDTFVASTRAVADLVASAGGASARAVVPEPVLNSVNQMLGSLQTVVEQVPGLTDEIEVLGLELHAKRLSIQALLAELDVLDQQLEILERALQPVQTWSDQWTRLQRTLAHVLDRSPDRAGPSTDTDTER